MWGIDAVARSISELNGTISKIGDQMLRQLGTMTGAVGGISTALESISRSQKRIAWSTVRPSGFSGVTINNVIGVDGMPVSNISLTVLPATSLDETASLRVEVHLDGFQVLTIPVDKAGGVALVAVPPGSSPLFEVAAIDFNGNVSDEVSLVVPAIDDTAPPTPEGFGGVTVNDTDTALPGFTELQPV